MRFSVDKRKIIHSLQQCYIPQKIHFSQDVLLEAKDGKLFLYTTDLFLQTEKIIDIELKEEGKICVPAKILYTLLKELPEGNVLFESEEKTLKITSNECVFNIRTSSYEDFPPPLKPCAPTLSMNSETLLRMIKTTIFSASTDELKPVLNGVLFEISKKSARMVATDGHRLACCEVEVEEVEKEVKTILAIKTLEQLQKMIEEDVNIGIGENIVTFIMKDSRLISKTVDGEFPDYRRVIPKEYKVCIEVEKEALLNATKRAMLSVERNYMKMSIEGDSLKVSTEDGVCRMEERINIIVHKPYDMQIAFTPKYIYDVARYSEGESMICKFTSPTTAALFSPKNKECFYVIMPVRV